MKVLFVTAEYPPAACGGIGVFYREMGKHLAALGADVHVLSLDGASGTETRSREKDVEVIRCGVGVHRTPRLRVGAWSFDGAAVSRARAFSSCASRIVEELRPDIVETHDWSAPLWRAPAHPFVVRLHGASSVLAQARGQRASRLQRFIERRMTMQADARIAVSEWIRAKSVATFGMQEDDFEVIPNGVDTQMFSPGAVERREEIVYAGALREDKGVPELLQALTIVLRERPDATATLAGGPNVWRDIPPRIQELAERVYHAAPGRLRLLGRVDQHELRGLYRSAGVCVFPSHAEAFGLACVEAMSCGAAVVASLWGAGAEIVENERSGLLANARDPADLAAAILRVLREPALGRRLGIGARRRVVERYSIRLAAERTLRFYESLERVKQTWRKQDVA